MALEHGKRYTQVTYVYPSTTVNAPSQNWPESFIFEHGKGEFRPGSPGAVDQLTIGLAHITVQPGWLYREVMDGVYDTSGTKPVFKEPSSVVPFPTPAVAAPEGQS